MVKERVIAAMSGGVDSAVAAGLLLEAGYDVVGITMKMYAPSRPAHAKSCCGIDDFDDARAQRRDRWAFRTTSSISKRRSAATSSSASSTTTRAGRTPNPCVSCNNFVKLGTLARLRRLARRALRRDRPLRARRASRRRPASLSQRARKRSGVRAGAARAAQLARLLLPLGELDKAATRAHARRLGLPVHDKSGVARHLLRRGRRLSRRACAHCILTSTSPARWSRRAGETSARTPESRTTPSVSEHAYPRARAARATSRASTRRRTRS